jgi:superfamily II DNA or RNA helicase
MNLSTRLARDFPQEIRYRGQKYFAQGLVRIQRGSATAVTAKVLGSRTYEVSLEYDDLGLEVWCDCPYEDGCCKHIWATILAADAHGYLKDAAEDDTLSLDYDDLDYEDQDRALGEVPPPPKPPPAWLTAVQKIYNTRAITFPPSHSVSTHPFDILYVVDVPASLSSACLVVSLESRRTDKPDSRPVTLRLKRAEIAGLPLAEDREIFSMIAGAKQYYGWGYSSSDGYEAVPSSVLLTHPLAEVAIRLMTTTGRCCLRADAAQPKQMLPLVWDPEPWRFELKLQRAGDTWALTGLLARGEETMDLSEPLLTTQGGLVFIPGRVAPLAENTPFEWLLHLRKQKSLVAPEQDCDAFLEALLCAPNLPPLQVPEELRFEEVKVPPRPALKIYAGRPLRERPANLRAELIFEYEGRAANPLDRSRGFYDSAARRFLRRDFEAERAAAARMQELGVRMETPLSDWPYSIAPAKLPRAVQALVGAGWHIEADGKIFRRPGAFRMDVSSGVDWFELHGEIDYGETTAKFPALLEALRRGDKMVRLDDGTFGVLPEEWLRRIGMVANLGSAQDSHIRFRPSQAGLLDALLASEPEARFDETFAKVREELRRFQGVEAAEQPAGFAGQLRDYQRDGLGWMHFLRRFSFGGCLADDMGVGKTAQALALLETRRELRAAGESLPPSLVVVPKSLVFNWKQEAARFTPQLRVLDYTGADRNGDDFSAYDLVITTYGTLRRDIPRLKDMEFDYLVLDEAQAVKNANTDASKAVRLLKGRHRLALSGTPVENHLGELWTLFEFLNPGMLGAATVFKQVCGSTRTVDERTRGVIAHAVRPFILRRTKEQVARELPPKTEQTVYCEMEPAQRKLYNELRQHYRNSLLKRIETQGMAKSKIQVLEALLRLRQAACHPGLLDPQRSAEGSAKLDVLMEQLREVLDEGHKALVFSQFTSLLRIVRDRLDDNGTVYEYLDGATDNRQAHVERFQNDDDCRLFLISLKAGGLGLNLTAAEYVFLLDPWWNPAVEAQAVDRAHRIGQTRQVFAYRLIARDTVEEKVLELQNMKRDLAAAIVTEDNSLIRTLRREDLELLLS